MEWSDWYSTIYTFGIDDNDSHNNNDRFITTGNMKYYSGIPVFSTTATVISYFFQPRMVLKNFD